jgi:hypothetical protein
MSHEPAILDAIASKLATTEAINDCQINGRKILHQGRVFKLLGKKEKKASDL